jgi:hypothetical protein
LVALPEKVEKKENREQKLHPEVDGSLDKARQVFAKWLDETVHFRSYIKLILDPG